MHNSQRLLLTMDSSKLIEWARAIEGLRGSEVAAELREIVKRETRRDQRRRWEATRASIAKLDPAYKKELLANLQKWQEKRRWQEKHLSD